MADGYFSNKQFHDTGRQNPQQIQPSQPTSNVATPKPNKKERAKLKKGIGK